MFASAQTPERLLPASPVAAVRLRVFRSAVVDGVAMSFAPMGHRAMAVVEVELEDGARGIGETWVNYPAWAWRERAATLAEGVAPLLLGRTLTSPAEAHDLLMAALRPLGRQWGAPGPVHQAVSGVDTALWDLAARHAGRPLAALLTGADVRRELPVYASSLGPDDVAATAERCAGAGHTAVKVKLGFGRDRDLANLRTARRVLGGGVRLFGDANQAWSLDEALDLVPALRDAGVEWLEEPLAGDDPGALAQLRRRGGLPLATGENLYGAAAFAPYVEQGSVDIVQPDLSKVGGPTEYLRVVALAAATGTTVNPHLYNGAVATAATLQVAAAVPATTAVEWDVRANRLREAVDHLLTDHGTVRVPDRPGLGVDLDLDAIADLEETL
ncbi:mandelate racemase/muconate lactonizing enzyme family protein [Pseudonocardia sp. MH-G8]|uniref:mandelate racemase/muconate lactonizing enzyme family protein n=1 Tax=Pseudonocardia sp. MH-G8 TaxID=1854588 RepID=UPI000BA08D68|nr:mandelate racemase/muconate lactonizing enzyme family protein [Pseudonocardia sp. MH-G8]OZM76455.1 mandelate racemase [Pseudonocardia sp. MH-G8]